jgi:thiamine biosynthesis lipoprotein
MTSEADRSPLPGKSAPDPSSSYPPPRGLSPRARIALPICAVLLFGLALHRLVLAPPNPPYWTFPGSTMGTRYAVKIARGEMSGEERAALAQVIEEELEHVNQLMSTWRDDSELSRFNAWRSTEPFSISLPTAQVFGVARAVSEQSGGAFDVTVAPLVAAWGFGATDRPLAPPSDAELRAIEGKVGYELIELAGDGRTLRKSHPEAQADLSAIAKGYGVDRVAEALVLRGYEDFLVEVGGELRARGRKRDGSSWRVGIERPDNEQRSHHRVVALRDISLATSGDYRNYYEVDGRRISHTIDPRVARPIEHNLASVSVLHEKAVWADALATAISVLGPQEGLAWAEAAELPALFLVREADGSFREIATRAFSEGYATPESTSIEP